jgi:hypothetical protein
MDNRLPISYTQKSRLDFVSEFGVPQGRVLVDWLMRFKYFSPKQVYVVVNTTDRFTVNLYTADHIYHITTTSSGYLGCTTTTRRQRPGEVWNRGSDLPDGEFSEDTLVDIIGAIVGYELKDVVNVVTSKATTPKVK